MDNKDIVIHFDMDGTLCEWKDLIPDIREYLKKEGNSLSDIEDIMSLPGTIEEYTRKIILTPSYYYDLKPYECVVGLAKELVHEGYDVRVLSCYPSHQAYLDKKFWLNNFLPEVIKAVFVPDGEGDRKIEHIGDIGDNGKMHILIDDHTDNLISFEEGLMKHNANGFAIKMMNDINGKNGVWQGRTLFFDNEVDESIHELQGYIGSYEEEKISEAER